MTRDELTDHIFTLVNEISPTAGLPVPIDAFADDQPIRDMVQGLLPEAATSVLLQSPPCLQPEVEAPAATGSLQPDGFALWPKPADFLALRLARLAHWQRPAVVAEAWGSAAALRQGNRYLRAGAAKPVVVDAGPALQLWPATQAAHLQGRVAYLPRLPAEELPHRLQNAACWRCAALYLQATGNNAASQLAEGRVEEALRGN